MAGVTRSGVDIQVNTDPQDYPFGNAPSIVKMASGGFMVIWSESNITRNNGDGGDVRAQIFSATGAAVGSEFIVNTTTTGTQALAKAVLLADNTIFIAWQDSSSNSGDIKGQLFSSTGAKVGSEILINTTTTGSQSSPSVAAVGGGNILVTWNDSSHLLGDLDGNSTVGQIVTPAGVKVGGEFLINTNTTGSQSGTKLATLTGGNVIVTWVDSAGQSGDTDGGSIRAQLVSSSGVKVGGEFQVNTITTGSQTAPAVTQLANGGFVITWQDPSGTLGDSDSSSIKAQLFDASGAKVGGEFLVNTTTAGGQQGPAIVTLDNGDFVITWTDRGIPGTPARQDLRGQLFSASGVKIGTEFVADNPIANLIEGSPAMAALGDGKFVVASAQSTYDDVAGTQSTRGMHAQIFAGSRDINGTTGNDALVTAAGADTIYASPGHDTIDGRTGTDRVVVNGDDHSLFAVTTGTFTYTLTGTVLTNSAGTLDTTLTSVEQIEIFDTSAANHIFNDNVGGTRFIHFGSGNDVLNGGGTITAELGGGTNQVNGRTSANDFLTLMVESGFAVGQSTALITDNAGGLLVSTTTSAGPSTTQIQNFENLTVQAVAGRGLYADASGTTATVSLVDSTFNDVLIGGPGTNVFISFSTGANSGTLTDLSTGNDYKFGGGGADTFDYSVAMPTSGVDHLGDVDSDDILDFSFYSGTSYRYGPTPTFIGTAAFSNVERQIRYEKIGAKTYIYTDVNGDGVTDGTVIIENGAFDLALTTNPNGGETVLKITLAQNFVNGTAAGETITSGTTGADVIRGFAGDDIIRATSGQDFIDGGKGYDRIDVSIGDATAFAAPTASRSYTLGPDRLSDLTGALNTATLDVDALKFSTVGAGNFGDTFDAHLFGGPVEFTLGNGQDTVTASASNDIIDGGGGVDKLYGGLGDDTYKVDRQDDLVFENSIEGTDTVISTANFYLYANLENLTLAAGSGNIFGVGNELANAINGNEGNNTLLAGAGVDVVHGGAGVDIIYGEDGNDQLFGDADNDFLAGGNGDDVMDGGTGGDSLYGEGGNDTLTGGSDFVFDQLVGGAGDDILHGDSGQGDYDYLYGNTGNDSFYVDTGDDLTFEQAGEGTDTVYANVAGANNGVYLYDNIENLVLLGTTTFGVGNVLANTMTGNASANYLLGGGGNDLLNGKAGNDVLFGEAGADVFVFEHGTGGDVIGDFVPGTDRIDLTAIGYTWQQVLNSMHENGGTTAIDLGNGDLVVLNGVTAAQLHQADFILSTSGSAPEPLAAAVIVPSPIEQAFESAATKLRATIAAAELPWLQPHWENLIPTLMPAM